MEEYPANNRRAKVAKAVEEPKKVEQVTTGVVVTRKKPLGKRVMDTFFGGDAKGVMGYIVQDVLIPAARDTLADAVSQAIERMIYGDSRGGGGSGLRRRMPLGHTNYTKFSSPSTARDEPRTISRRSRVTQDFDEIILSTRAEAEEVLSRLNELIDKYNEATVADLYDLVGVAANFADNKWGWSDPRAMIHAGVIRTRNGYLLELPKPEQLD